MKYILSRYNHDISWLEDYTDDFVIYDRSLKPIPGSIIVPNIGSDIYDKFTYIIDNYDTLPEVAVYTKANIFKYINKSEFNRIKNNRYFTPILTKTHKEKNNFSFYMGGMYYELNNYWYLNIHKPKSMKAVGELTKILGIHQLAYVPFAPGSNYILTRENIHRHSRDFYARLRSYLDWDIYPGEAQIIERGLYTLWR